MSASIAERIAAAVQTALLAEPVIPEVGPRVDRAREEAYSRDELVEGALNVKSREERTKLFSEAADDCELDLDVEVHVRAEDVWETVADRIATQAHTRIVGRNYRTDGLTIARVRKTGRTPDGDAGDYTPGRLTLTYTFRYLTLADDITRQP